MTLDELTTTQQHYLEVVYREAKEGKEPVHLTAIADVVGVRPSSATEVIARLKDIGLLEQAPRETISLTKEGCELASQLALRHETIRDFFTRVLRVPEEQAEEDACKVEHAVGATTYGRLCDFLEHIESDAVEHDRTVPLTLMNKGEAGRLARVTGGRGKASRLAAMGVREGEMLEVLQNARGGPVMVKVGNSRIAIGRVLATCLHVAPGEESRG